MLALVNQAHQGPIKLKLNLIALLRILLSAMIFLVILGPIKGVVAAAVILESLILRL